MQSRATVRGASVTPQKARLVANMVRGVDVGEAVEILSFTAKKTAPILRKLIESAVANAEYAAERSSESLQVDDLYVATVTVDSGPRLRRWRPRAQGRATRIEKASCHITVVLETR